MELCFVLSCTVFIIPLTTRSREATYCPSSRGKALFTLSKLVTLPKILYTPSHANVRAVKSKTARLREYISSTDMDIFALTETWLTEKDTAAKLEIYSPESHSFIQQDRNGRRGGGTGLLFKKAIDVKKIAAGEKSSFEFSEWRVSFNSLRAKLVVVYRPPYSEAHPITPRVFLRSLALISRQLLYPRSLSF